MEENTDKTELEQEPKKNQLGKMIPRVLISIVAFIVLIKFGKVDLGEAFKHLLKMNPYYFALAFFSYMVTITLSGSRFFITSRALGFRKNLYQCIQLNYVGTFFNNFLPTTFGGDAMRGYYLKSGTNLSITRAAGCLLYERYAGMVVLFWVTSLVFILRDLGMISKSWEVPSQMALFTHLGTIGSLFVVPFLPKIKAMIFGKENWIYKKFVEPILVFWNDYKIIAQIYSLSILLQFTVVLCHYFIAKSLGLEIPLSYYLVFYPLTTIAGFLIPSLNGLGVREGSYIYFLSKVNVASDQALAFSMGFLIILLMYSVIGGFIYMFGDFRKNMPHCENELLKKSEEAELSKIN